jgi:hypothetical protein
MNEGMLAIEDNPVFIRHLRSFDGYDVTKYIVHLNSPSVWDVIVERGGDPLRHRVADRCADGAIAPQHDAHILGDVLRTEREPGATEAEDLAPARSLTDNS